MNLYYTYLISFWLLILAFAFVSRKVTNTNKIVDYISKVLYMLVVPASIGYKLDEKFKGVFRTDYLLIALIFLIVLVLFAFLLVKLFNLKKTEKWGFILSLSFAPIFVMEDVLLKLTNKDLISTIFLLMSISYLVIQFMNKSHSPEEFITALAVILLVFLVAGLDAYIENIEALEAIAGLFSGVNCLRLVGLGLIISKVKLTSLLTDRKVIFISLARMIILPLFVYILVTAFSQDRALVETLVLLSAMPISGLLILDNYKNSRLMGIFIWSSILSLVSLPLIRGLLL
ncbi:MAG: hypothetical protein SPI59_05630 [Finegoldia sp.]|nr:hypothetical protein [Finegoldia sp.]